MDKIYHRTFVGDFLKKYKIDLTVREYDKIFKNDIAVIGGMSNLIMQLYKKYKIALATNEGRIFTKYKIEGSGLKNYFSKIITSYELKAAKPEIKFYSNMLTRLKTRAKECLFIDDDVINIRSAEKFGIKGIIFRNSGQLKKELLKMDLFTHPKGE